MKKKYHINILEQELSVLSDAGDDHVANVVRCVRDKVEQVRGASSNINILNVAILAALNIADEYLKQMAIDEKTCNQLESRTESLISLMDGMK